MTMEIRRVDREDVRWTFDLPAYRVSFWERKDQRVYACSSFDLIGWHNVREIIAWADENASPNRHYTVYALIHLAEDIALIRLFGIDPTKHKGDQSVQWPGEVYL